MDPVSHDSTNTETLSQMSFGIHPLVLIGVALLLVILCAIFYVIQSGIFTKIEVKTIAPKRGSMIVAYKTGKGPYKGAGELFTEACCLVLDREHIGICNYFKICFLIMGWTVEQENYTHSRL